MKLFLIPLLAFTISQVQAHIEHVPGEDKGPSTQEINKNRACFEELATQGCGEPGENLKEFRTCLHASFPSLTDDCKQMMSKLYSRKN